MQTEGEVLVRMVKVLADATYEDMESPRAKTERSRFDDERLAAGLDVDVKGTPPLRKLFFSPLLMRFISSLRAFGEPYRTSSFFKVPFLGKVQDEFGGVSLSILWCARRRSSFVLLVLLYWNAPANH